MQNSCIFELKQENAPSSDHTLAGTQGPLGHRGLRLASQFGAHPTSLKSLCCRLALVSAVLPVQPTWNAVSSPYPPPASANPLPVTQGSHAKASSDSPKP